MLDKGMLEKLKKQAVLAGIEIMKIYESGDLGVESKGDDSPLTRADKASNNIIVDFLTKEYPEMAILSEEEKDSLERLNNKCCFVVDPLDGTKEFIKRNGEFTVNIALAEDNKSILGVIYVPVTRELYYAQKGCGAYYERLSEDLSSVDVRERLEVSGKLERLCVVGSKSHMSDEFKDLMEEQKEKIEGVRSFGSSLKGCMVAKQVADLYYRFGPTMEWDTAAMQCVVEEAGAIMRFIDNTEITYNRRDSVNKGFYIVNREENIFV